MIEVNTPDRAIILYQKAYDISEVRIVINFLPV